MRDGLDLYVVVYNGLGSSKSTIVRLPVSVDGSFHVSKVGGNSLQTHYLRSSPNHFAGTDSTSASFVLLFDTGPLPPVGAAVFRVTQAHEKETIPSSEISTSRRLKYIDTKDGPSEVVASNGIVTVHFDKCVFGRSYGLLSHEFVLRHLTFVSFVNPGLPASLNQSPQTRLVLT